MLAVPPSFSTSQMIKHFGAATTVFATSTRKALTVMLSFVLFPKPGSILHLVGAALVGAGIYLQYRAKHEKQERKSHEEGLELEPSQNGSKWAGNGSDRASAPQLPRLHDESGDSNSKQRRATETV